MNPVAEITVGIVENVSGVSDAVPDDNAVASLYIVILGATYVLGVYTLKHLKIYCLLGSKSVKG